MTPQMGLKKLKQARKWIQRGWTQGSLFKHEGGRWTLCAMGALIFASHRKARKQFVGGTWSEEDLREDPCPLTSLLHEGMEQSECLCGSANVKNMVGCVEKYNDAPMRKKAEVLALFDRAILFQAARVAAGETVAIPVEHQARVREEECVGCQ